MLQTLAVELLTDNPELLLVVAVVARLARASQAGLTWAEYRTLHRFKRGVFPVVDRVAGNAILWVSEKGGREDDECLMTLEGGVRDVVRDLKRNGGSLHLLNSLKRRPDTHGDPLSAAHLIWTADGTQTEAYLFDNDDGTVDVYAHTEASVDDPLKHLIGGQTDGDPRGVVPNLSNRKK